MTTEIRGDTEARKKLLQKSKGRHWENKVFKCCGSDFPEPKHAPWREALEEAISEQSQAERNWNPKKPSTPIAREMFDCVKSYLHPTAAEKLQFYCTVGTAFDHYHRSDCVFMIDRYCVCVDITTREKVGDGIVVIVKQHDMKTRFWRVAKQIADAFNNEFLKG